MFITITAVPNELVRNKQVGDWKFTTNIIAAAVDKDAIHNEDSQLAIGIHELVEAYICRKMGISDDVVCAFDKEFEAERDEEKHTEAAEPGDDEHCPYREAHQAATFVERAVCAALNLSWIEHSQLVIESGEDHPKTEFPDSQQP